MKFIAIIFLLFLSYHTAAQPDNSEFTQKVLKSNAIGKKFTSGVWNEKGDTETNLTYLGAVKSKNGKTYKIMNSIWTWGISGRVTNRILIFNDRNQYLGNYPITDSENLPIALKKGYLIFKNSTGSIFKVYLGNGIPEKLYQKNTTEYNYISDFQR